MGTNYYAHFNICNHCKRFDIVHIGKSSAGWTFSFHATDKIKSWDDWQLFLQDSNVKIFDEYDRELSYSQFLGMVEAKKSEKNNHAKYSKEGGSYLDKEGNSMSPYEFS